MLPDFDAGEVTLLAFDEIPIPPYSARGITEAFAPDWEPDQKRTWNSVLKNLTPPQMRYLRLTITCTDMELPALEVVPTGFVLTVNCVTEFTRAASTGDNDREAVPGSEYTEDGITRYRPRLRTMVETFEYIFDEWNAVAGWTLVLREVGDEAVSE